MHTNKIQCIYVKEIAGILRYTNMLLFQIIFLYLLFIILER